MSSVKVIDLLEQGDILPDHELQDWLVELRDKSGKRWVVRRLNSLYYEFCVQIRGEEFQVINFFKSDLNIKGVTLDVLAAYIMGKLQSYNR